MKEKFLQIPVSTVDETKQYKVLRPIFTQISNKGISKGSLYQFSKEYQEEINEASNTGLIRNDASIGNFFEILFTPHVGQTEFDKAFQIGIMELQKKAYLIGADAVIGMHTDIDLDTTGFQYFYLQMYGTAIEYIDENGLTKRQRIEKYWNEHQTAYNAIAKSLEALQSQLRTADQSDQSKIDKLTAKIQSIEEELYRDR